MANIYRIQNATAVTTAAPVKQPTGNAIRTMLQVLNANVPYSVVAWGCAFDASAAATPGQLELLTTGTVAATMSTALVAGDIQLMNGEALTNATTGFTLTTSGCAFATAAVTEGSITTTRHGDSQMVAPTNQYIYQWPLDYEFYVPATTVLRVRATFGATVNMTTWVAIRYGG